MASAASRRLFWGTIVGIVALDLVTKFLAEGVLSRRPVPVIGDYVVLRAEMDVIMAFSACPQDILPINGVLGKTVEAHFQVLG